MTAGAHNAGHRPTLSATQLQAVLRALVAGSVLYFWEPSGDFRLVELRGELVIGRDASCGVALSWDRAVSRVHAVIRPLGSEWTIADEGLSRNGTYLNGDRVKSARRLANGDAVAVGATVLTYRSSRQSFEADTEAAPPPGGSVTVTPAQRRVLESLCRALSESRPDAVPASNREIAAELVLSVETVKSHMRALEQQLRVDHLPQGQRRYVLAQNAIRLGLVPRA